MGDKIIPVRVAVRARPLSAKEEREGCQDVIRIVEKNNQVYFHGGDKAFTFDFAFGVKDSQSKVYDKAVKGLITQLFEGYNVTVLAYGQTGSGKTYSIGTSYSASTTNDTVKGIIPRAVTDIFEHIASDPSIEVTVRASFIELYKETLYDLLSSSSLKKEDCTVEIREDPKGGIKIVGLEEVPVSSLDDTMSQLECGSSKRVTAATAMNNVSSRSHAIFTLTLEITKKDDGNTIVSKFHLVDLAGSERQKKTKASGERLREGIDINKGLLCLGNVISALGERTSDKQFIPYRDSKLTRILQDSLGGNSHTLMIACISPADINMDESMSTLRYADRARKIKNKPIVNTKEEETGRLRLEIAELRSQLLSYQTGGVNIDSKELEFLKNTNEQLKSENGELTNALVMMQDEVAHMSEKLLISEGSFEKLKTKLTELECEAQNVANKSEATEEVVGMWKKIRSVVAEFKDLERALVEHEMSRHNGHDNSSSMGDDSCEEGPDGEEDEKEYAAHAMKQNALANQLQNLNKMLAQKEQLATQMSANDEKLKAMQEQYEETMKKMETEINALQNEKDSLVGQMKSEPSSKIAEQRRKRIQELEGLIQDLRRKVLEQQKAVKMNEKNEAKIKKLNEDIRSMKQIKVKLIRQMKEDSDKVRQWKQQKEKELIRLKQNERKQQAKMVKMENLHSKKENVLKRKMEQAQAINKRLREAMEKQKAAKELRSGMGKNTGMVGAGPRIRNWIQGEMDVIIGVKEAQQTKENLIKERTALTSQINRLKREMRQTMTESEMKESSAKLRELEDGLHSRNEHIANLQKQLMDCEDDKTIDKLRWDTLQSMTEAKLALEYLFEKASENGVQTSLTQSRLSEIKEQYEEAVKGMKDLEEEIHKMKIEHENELVKAEREREEKVLYILKQITGSNGSTNIDAASSVEERLRLQAEEISKFSNLHEELLKMSNECDKLKKQIESDSKQNKSLGPKRKKPSPERKTIEEVLNDVDESMEEDSEDEHEDPDWSDPDWKKTPLFRRIKRLKEEHMSIDIPPGGQKRKLLSTVDEGAPAFKRSSSEQGCGCKTGCKTARCKCRKSKKLCVGCKCDETCRNKEGERDETVDGSVLADKTNDTVNTCSLLNETFDISDLKPSPPKENDENATPVNHVRRTIFKSPMIEVDDESEDAVGTTPVPSTVRRNYFKSPVNI